MSTLTSATHRGAVGWWSVAGVLTVLLAALLVSVAQAERPHPSPAVASDDAPATSPRSAFELPASIARFAGTDALQTPAQLLKNPAAAQRMASMEAWLPEGTPAPVGDAINAIARPDTLVRSAIEPLILSALQGEPTPEAMMVLAAMVALHGADDAPARKSVDTRFAAALGASAPFYAEIAFRDITAEEAEAVTNLDTLLEMLLDTPLLSDEGRAAAMEQLQGLREQLSQQVQDEQLQMWLERVRMVLPHLDRIAILPATLGEPATPQDMMNVQGAMAMIAFDDATVRDAVMDWEEMGGAPARVFDMEDGTAVIGLAINVDPESADMLIERVVEPEANNLADSRAMKLSLDRHPGAGLFVFVNTAALMRLGIADMMAQLEEEQEYNESAPDPVQAAAAIEEMMPEDGRGGLTISIGENRMEIAQTMANMPLLSTGLFGTANRSLLGYLPGESVGLGAVKLLDQPIPAIVDAMREQAPTMMAMLDEQTAGQQPSMEEVLQQAAAMTGPLTGDVAWASTADQTIIAAIGYTGRGDAIRALKQMARSNGATDEEMPWEYFGDVPAINMGPGMLLFLDQAAVLMVNASEIGAHDYEGAVESYLSWLADEERASMADELETLPSGTMVGGSNIGRVMNSSLLENLPGETPLGDLNGNWFADYWVWQTMTLGDQGIRFAWEAEGATTMLVGLVAAIAAPVYQSMQEQAAWNEARAMASTVDSAVAVYVTRNGGLGEVSGTRLVDATGEWTELAAALRLDENTFMASRLFDPRDIIVMLPPSDDMLYNRGVAVLGGRIPGSPSGMIIMHSEGDAELDDVSFDTEFPNDDPRWAFALHNARVASAAIEENATRSADGTLEVLDTFSGEMVPLESGSLMGSRLPVLLGIDREIEYTSFFNDEELVVNEAGDGYYFVVTPSEWGGPAGTMTIQPDGSFEITVSDE